MTTGTSFASKCGTVDPPPPPPLAPKHRSEDPVKPKREVPFRQLTSTLLTSKTPDGGAFRRDGLQGRRAIWDGQVCFSFYPLTNINMHPPLQTIWRSFSPTHTYHPLPSPNELEDFITHCHPISSKSKREDFLQPIPPLQTSRRDLRAQPQSALRMSVRGPCNIPLHSSIECEGFFIAHPQPSPLQMSGSFFCRFAFPLFLIFASDSFVDYTQ